jgi:outer membrane protein assembly factor BamB
MARRTLTVGVALLALAGALRGVPGAPALGGGGVAAETTPTWGTAPEGKKAGRVLAVLEATGRIFLAGEFTALIPPGASGPPVPRSYLAALDAASGELTEWSPAPDGPVKALALSPDGGRLYVGGDFDTLGGSPARNLAAIDLTTGQPDAAFSPARLDSEVRALAVHGDRLYVGGDFTRIFLGDGVTERRPQLAALDATTGDLLDWMPPRNGGGEFFGQTGQERSSGDGVIYALATSADGHAVYAAGTFLDFGGRKGLVALDASSGRAFRWQADMDRPVFGLATSPADGHTLYAATGGAGGRLYAFDPGRSRRATWEVRVDGDAVGVVASHDTVYLLGHYDYIVSARSDCYRHCPGGPERRHLAAFDAATGTLTPWAPVANTSTGPYTGAIGTGALYVGGEFTEINRSPQPGLAVFPGSP